MDIVFERRVAADELTAAFRSFAAELTVFAGTSSQWLSASPHDVSLLIDQDGEGAMFGQHGVDLVVAEMRPGRDFEVWLCGLARALSQSLATRTGYGGAPLTEDPRNPFWCVVWDGDRPFLGDDSHLDADDRPPGPVRVIRPLGLEEVEFASREQLADWVARVSR